MNRASVRQATALARRSVLGTLRQPAVIFPPIFFPLFFCALNSAAFARSTNLPGFPKVDSFLDFIVASTVIQGVLFASSAGGADMAQDIQTGFFDRLVASPVARSSILVGRLAGAAVLGAVQATVFMVVLSLFGAEIKGGPAGALAIVGVAVLLAIGVGGFSIAIALKTGSSEAVQAFFPLFFISLFLSSAFFPRELMKGWFKAVATYNPLSVMIESVRTLVIEQFTVAAAAKAIGIVLAICVVSLTVASGAMRKRIAGPA